MSESGPEFRQMSEFARPRGLGRGLSALLGEPVKADFGAPPARETAPQSTPQPAPAAHAWSQPIQPAPQPAPTPPPANVVELPVAHQPPAPEPAPVQTAAAPTSSGEGGAGPKSISIDLVQRNPGQPRKHFDESDLNELAQSIRAHG